MRNLVGRDSGRTGIVDVNVKGESHQSTTRLTKSEIKPRISAALL
jgi:hypothetical protein